MPADWKRNCSRRTADLLTLARLALLPPLLAVDANGSFLSCFTIVVIMDASDVLDGMLAKRSAGGSVHGAVFDLGVDCTAVLSLLIFHAAIGEVSPLLPALTALCFATFCLQCAFKKSVQKNRIGRYAGTVLFCLITGIFFLKAFLADRYALVVPWMANAASAYLAVSIGENAVHIAGSFRRRGASLGSGCKERLG